MSSIAAAALLLLGAAPSSAQPAPSGAAALSGVEAAGRKPPPTALSGLDVVARRATPLSGVTVGMKACPEGRRPPDPAIPPPKLVSTFPAKGGKVRPGVLVLRLTFDRPMTCAGVLDSEGYRPNPCPAPLTEPMISHDRRTFLTVCMTEANYRYGIRLRRFESLAGRPAPPSKLEFETSLARPTRTVEQALAQDPWMLQMASTER
jgi:hypothetical protein